MSVDRQDGDLWGCAKCARITKTCCQTREVLVTEGDKARIADFVGYSDFWEHQAASDPDYLDQDDDPNWLKWAFRPDGTRPVLKRRPDGDCAFLTPLGCRLPLETRPLVCRIYPYNYTEKGVEGIAEGCPSEVVPPGSTILKVLDMRLDDAKRWHKMLYTELQTKEPYHARGTDLRSEG